MLFLIQYLSLVGTLERHGYSRCSNSTTISYILGMNIMITIIRNENLLSFPSIKFIKLLKFSFPVLVIGPPAAFTMMLSPIVLGYINKIVSSHGSEAVAAFGVGLRRISCHRWYYCNLLIINTIHRTEFWS